MGSDRHRGLPTLKQSADGTAHEASASQPSIHVHRWRGEAAVTFAAGPLEATFLPDLGMLGASLRRQGRELLYLRGGLSGYRQGRVAALPLLAPWANRLSRRSYRVAGVKVDLATADLHLDDAGLPIHGTMTAQPGWQIVTTGTEDGAAAAARLHARFDYGSRADLLASFPFPHEIDIEIALSAEGLHVVTTVRPTSDRPVPVSFGYHPYFALPGGGRRSWLLGLPARRHLALDERGIPSGAGADEAAEHGPIGPRTFDDLFELGDDRTFTLEGGGERLTLRIGEAYRFAQLFVPPSGTCASNRRRLRRTPSSPGRARSSGLGTATAPPSPCPRMGHPEPRACNDLGPANDCGRRAS